MGLRVPPVDAFTDMPFRGNLTMVCLLAKPADTQWMQQVAHGTNLPETAFLYREEDGLNLRWFTLAVEVDLCGHAALASAYVLWEEGHLICYRDIQLENGPVLRALAAWRGTKPQQCDATQYETIGRAVQAKRDSEEG